MCFVDFDAAKLFGESSHILTRPVGRGLQTKDPRKVERYNGHLYQQLEYHKLQDKIKKLVRRSEQRLWSERNILYYEKIDSQITEILRSTEKVISRRYSTKCEWSPQLVQSVFAMRFWKLKKKQILGSKVKPSTLLNHCQLANLPETCLQQHTLETIIVAFKKAINTM
jgi:hypothetical protein